MKALLTCLLVLLPVASAAADELDRPFENWQAHRFRNVQKQHTDFTCGAAAMSIIAQIYWGKQIAEPQFTVAIREMYTKEEWKQKEKDGLSLLDMKKAAEKMGLKAEGLKLTPGQLFALKGPVVIHFDKGFIQHFSVYKGVEGDRVYIADPITGNSRLPLYRFLREWTGYALAIWPEGQPLPAKNNLAPSPDDGPNELLAIYGALYADPGLTKPAFSPLMQ
jgi:predicted double-glycine peptidase